MIITVLLFNRMKIQIIVDEKMRRNRDGGTCLLVLGRIVVLKCLLKQHFCEFTK